MKRTDNEWTIIYVSLTFIEVGSKECLCEGSLGLVDSVHVCVCVCERERERMRQIMHNVIG